MIQSGIFAMIGLIMANYTYQFFTEKNYEDAARVSYFQVVAIATMIIVVLIKIKHL